MNTADVPGVVKLVSRDFHITEEESSGVLQRLIEGNDLTLYDLSNAVTRHSQDVEGTMTGSTALEGIGYNILSMPAAQWSRINQMAALSGCQPVNSKEERTMYEQNTSMMNIPEQNAFRFPPW